MTETVLLAIETATPICSVALKTPDNKVVSRSERGKGVHSEKVFLFAKQLLDEQGLHLQDVTEGLISAGPGSFTGLRVGSSAIKGMLFETGARLWACNTLCAIATGALKHAPDLQVVHAVIDARRNHLYHQQFHNKQGVAVPVSGKAIRELATFDEWLAPEHGIAGTGIDRLSFGLVEPCRNLGDVVAAEHLIALYTDRHELLRPGTGGQQHPQRHPGQQEWHMGEQEQHVIRPVSLETFEPAYQVPPAV